MRCPNVSLQQEYYGRLTSFPLGKLLFFLPSPKENEMRKGATFVVVFGMGLARKEKAGGMNHGETRPILILNTRRKSTPLNWYEKKPGRKPLTTDTFAAALR
uniref:Uncharacterized protein n=1 Tax=Desulfomonile tiedjei TaxID=2358 RepID=A0A7C4ES11_9BACT